MGRSTISIHRFFPTLIKQVQDRIERQSTKRYIRYDDVSCDTIIISQRKYLNNTLSYRTISLYINIVIDFVANSPRKKQAQFGDQPFYVNPVKITVRWPSIKRLGLARTRTRTFVAVENVRLTTRVMTFSARALAKRAYDRSKSSRTEKWMGSAYLRAIIGHDLSL